MRYRKWPKSNLDLDDLSIRSNKFRLSEMKCMSEIKRLSYIFEVNNQYVYPFFLGSLYQNGTWKWLDRELLKDAKIVSLSFLLSDAYLSSSRGRFMPRDRHESKSMQKYSQIENLRERVELIDFVFDRLLLFNDIDQIFIIKYHQRSILTCITWWKNCRMISQILLLNKRQTFMWNPFSHYTILKETTKSEHTFYLPERLAKVD